VINSFNVTFPDEIFWFMHDLGVSFSANPCTAKPNDPEEVKALAISPTQYAVFLLRLLELWLKLDDKSFRIRPLDDIVKGVLGKQPSLCRYLGDCARYITIDSNGDVYPCDAFLDGNYLLGNLVEQGLQGIFAGAALVSYYESRSTMWHACRQCEWFLICKGGCMREWEGKKEIADPRDEEFCGARRWLFTQARAKLAQLGYEVQNVTTG